MHSVTIFTVGVDTDFLLLDRPFSPLKFQCAFAWCPLIQCSTSAPQPTTSWTTGRYQSCYAVTVLQTLNCDEVVWTSVAVKKGKTGPSTGGEPMARTPLPFVQWMVVHAWAAVRLPCEEIQEGSGKQLEEGTFDQIKLLRIAFNTTAQQNIPRPKQMLVKLQYST